MVMLCGCVSTEVKLERQAEKDRLEEQRQVEEARLEEQRQAEKAEKRERALQIIYKNFGSPDRALMSLGAPTSRAEGDKIFILEY